MADSKTVLVSGATGNQGGAVARELLAHGYRVRAMTRKPLSDPARALGKLGAELVQGDLDDEASIARALAGAWGTFAVQNTWVSPKRTRQDPSACLATPRSRLTARMSRGARFDGRWMVAVLLFIPACCHCLSRR